MEVLVAGSRYLDTAPLIPRLGDDGRPLVPMVAAKFAARASVLEELADGRLRYETAACLCGRTEADATLLAQKDRYGIPMGTWLCPCGMGFTSPRLAEASLERFYREHYRLLYGGRKHPTPHGWQVKQRKGQELLEHMRRHVGLPAGGRVVDIGCGNGGYLAPFRAAGFQVAGCDHDADVMAPGRDSGLDLRVGELDVLEDVAPFDLAIVNHVIEHIPRPGPFLDQLAGMLAPGGHVYFEAPGLRRLYRTYRDIGRGLQNAHLWHFTVGTLRWLVEPHGFRLVHGHEKVRAIFCRGEAAAPPLPMDRDGIVAMVRRNERILPARNLASRLRARVLGR